MQPIILDERLQAAAALALEALDGKSHPLAADVGCDHGFLSAYLLEHVPGLTVCASDVSAPSLEKARTLFAARGLAGRAHLDVADGLSALPENGADVVMILGMGAGTILKILTQGLEKVGQASVIVQANVDLPQLRMGLCELGFALQKEVFCCAAGRHYVTILAKKSAEARMDERHALLGAAVNGVQNEAQRAYFTWQRSVHVREMEQLSVLDTDRVRERLAACGRELQMISEALGMKTCTVADVEQLVGEIAPYELAEDWDNVGLLFGRAKAPVQKILVALDLTQERVEEAKALGAQLIVTHHPIMFSARKRITDQDREGRLMLSMAEAGIAHIAAHTNLDSAPGGVNDTLMNTLGAKNVRGEGFVRVGELPEGMTLERLCMKAQQKLKGPVRAYGAPDTPVHVLGCCSGAGSGEIALAMGQGADCFITGEVRHHEALDAVDAGCCVLEAGHFETENPVCEVLSAALQNAADAVQYNVTVFCSKGNPFGRR